MDGLIPAGPRVQVENPRPGVYKAGGAMLPLGFIEALEQNQTIASCCRHPERHDIASFYSSVADAQLGIPDVYVFFCQCGRQHRRLCVSPPETAAVLAYCTRPDFDSSMVEAFRPIWGEEAALDARELSA